MENGISPVSRTLFGSYGLSEYFLDLLILFEFIIFFGLRFYLTFLLHVNV